MEQTKIFVMCPNKDHEEPVDVFVNAYWEEIDEGSDIHGHVECHECGMRIAFTTEDVIPRIINEEE